jgi:hypothetical protein
MPTRSRTLPKARGVIGQGANLVDSQLSAVLNLDCHFAHMLPLFHKIGCLGGVHVQRLGRSQPGGQRAACEPFCGTVEDRTTCRLPS